MASVNNMGNIQARCYGCKGALTGYGWRAGDGAPQYGAVAHAVRLPEPRGVGKRDMVREYRLYRCAGCGGGAMAVLIAPPGVGFPSDATKLEAFYAEAPSTMPIPDEVPIGIAREFREAEACLGEGHQRAAAGLFRSVLDKTMRANGYKVKPGTTLEQMIDMAADDGVITVARKLRAHQDIRVLGNDVLHDEWQAIDKESVEEAHHYAQRILEDLYDDRDTVLKLLWKAGRLPAEGPEPPETAPAP